MGLWWRVVWCAMCGELKSRGCDLGVGNDCRFQCGGQAGYD